MQAKVTIIFCYSAKKVLTIWSARFFFVILQPQK